MSVDVRTYKDTDPAVAKERQFLALVAARGMAVTIYGSSKKEAKAAAEAFLAREREKAAAGNSTHTKGKAKP